MLQGIDNRTLNGGRKQEASLAMDPDNLEDCHELKRYLDAAEATRSVSKNQVYRVTLQELNVAIEKICCFLPARQWPKDIREYLLTRFIRADRKACNLQKVHDRCCPFMPTDDISLKDPTINVMHDYKDEARLRLFDKMYWHETVYGEILKGRPAFHVVGALCAYGVRKYSTFDPLEAPDAHKLAVKECLVIWGYLCLLLTDTAGAEQRDRIATKPFL